MHIYASQNRTVENKYSDLKRSYSYMCQYINRFIVIKIVAIYVLLVCKFFGQKSDHVNFLTNFMSGQKLWHKEEEEDVRGK